MLLHLAPRILWPYKNAAIVDLEVKAFGLRLVGGVDLITRRPYPNKNYKVACRKTRHGKAYNGILIETSGPVGQFETVARWALEAETVVTHHVHYRLLDHDFDAASENMMLWSATFGGEWSDRCPLALRGIATMKVEPVMKVLPDESMVWAETSDTLVNGWIVKRSQVFDMPTIERGRMQNPLFHDRMPPLDSAFFVAAGP